MSTLPHVALTMVLIAAAAILAPLLADRLGRWLPIPLVVYEILLGLLIGPSVLGWAHEDEIVTALSDYGLAMLMFLAGYEIQFSKIRGGPLKRGLGAWGISLILGLAIGWMMAGSVNAGVFIGTALTTTALGTILPILRDAGDLDTRFGSYIMAAGAVGEFGPIIAIALFLSGRNPGQSAVLVAVFAGLTAVGIVLGLRPRPPRVAHLITVTMRSSAQFAVRMVILLLTLMVFAAAMLGLDMLLGAFASGILAKLFLSGSTEEESEVIMSKLEGIGFGFLVPIFFIVTGITFDLGQLTSSVGTILMLPVYLLLFVVVRGVPSYVLTRGHLDRRDRRALAMYSSTALPLVVAITAIGVERGHITSATAAALVGAGMVSVLSYPLIALKLRRERRMPPSTPASEAW